AVRDAAAFDRRNFHRAPLHHFDTGGEYRPGRHRKNMLEKDLADAQARMADDTPAATAELAHYLNARSPRLFSERVEARKHAVMGVLLREPFVTDEDRFVPLSGLVRGLVEQPVPLYTTSRRTQRLVAYGEGLHTAPTWMRRLFLHDLFELDAA